MTGVDSFLPLLLSQGRVRENKFSCAVCGVIRRGAMIAFSAGTHSTVGEGSNVEATPKSLFDVASVTKAIPIALLVLWAVTQRLIKLDDDVCRYFPSLRVKHGRRLTIRHLLTYGCKFELGHITPPYTEYGDSAWLLNEILSAGVEVMPTLSYGNYPPILLALILERVTGKTIQELSQEILFNPLGMNSATFNPPNDKFLVVETEIDPLTQQPRCGVVHDELTAALALPGSAGLFVNTIDLLRMLHFLLNDGGTGTQQIIDPELIRGIGKNQFKQGDNGFGFGFGQWPVFSRNLGNMKDDLCGMDPDLLAGAYFKNGFTGTSVFAFPKLEIGVVINTNHVHPVRKGSQLWMNLFRYVIVMTALTGRVPVSSAKLLWGSLP